MNTDKNNTQLPQSSVSVSVTELRIGNIVTVDNPEFRPELKGIDLIITSISYDSIGLDFSLKEPNKFYESISQKPEFVKPIKITELKLLEYGFIEEDYAGGCYSKNGISIDMDDFNCVVKTKWLDIEIKYFHKLQNLHFSLYNVELQDVVLTEH